MAFKEHAGSREEITFLYKFVNGACPKSFGINVARMAGIPKAILKRAAEKSKQFSTQMEKITNGIKN